MHPDELAACILVPSATDDKYARGVLGTVTGSDRFPGAAVLGVEAAASTGVGMVRVVASEAVARLVLARRPEVVVGHGRVQAWLLGSGIDAAERDEATRTALERAIADDVPVVLDAGALDLAEAVRGRAVLTPHAGELARLLGPTHPGVDRSAIAREPARWARVASESTGCVVLLKGATTVVADGSETVEVPIATRWLATAGSGDVLAGILGALVATHAPAPPLATLAVAAASLHDRAAAAASAGGPIAALDVAEALPATIARLRSGAAASSAARQEDAGGTGDERPGRCDGLDRQEIVCICGSARFADEMRAANRELTLAGMIVVAPGEAGEAIADEQKAALDALHLRKIDLADRVLVVNPGGYVGESTSREIAYARAAGKPVSFTTPV